MQFPYLIPSPGSSTQLRSWLPDHVDLVSGLLGECGAVLLRGFEVHGPDDFRTAAGLVLGELMQYVEGASPRLPLGGGVYTSTEYSPDLTVALHNELSYGHRWPGRVAFYCRRPAAHGGQTPIADSRKVFKRLVRDSPKGLPSEVTYLRTMSEGEGPGVPWPVVFAMRDQAEVEDYCRAASIETQWLPDGGLRTVQTRPTAIVHPQTGEPVWFNQLHQWHPSNAGAETEEILRAAFGADLPMNAVSGNGDELDRDILRAVRQAYESEKIVFDWHAGDVMFLDNMLTAHGRTPYSGTREVLVALGLPVWSSEVTRVEL